MIDLYYWPTPNGKKVSIFLEETGIPYKVIPVEIARGDQFAPEYLKLNPNHRMPVIVDHAPQDGGAPLSVFAVSTRAYEPCCRCPQPEGS